MKTICITCDRIPCICEEKDDEERNTTAIMSVGSSEIVMSQREKYLELAKRIIHDASEASLKDGHAHKEKKSDRLFAYNENH